MNNITLHQYFCGQAIAGLCAHFNFKIKDIPQSAILIADTMIEKLTEREKDFYGITKNGKIER